MEVAPFMSDDDFDVLADWVARNLFSSNSYDKISNRTIAQDLAKKATIELGDAIFPDHVIDAISKVNWEKNFDLEKYSFE